MLFRNDQVLGVSTNATAAEIRSKFRSLALQLHPDKFGAQQGLKDSDAADETKEDDDSLGKDFQIVQQAWTVLRSPRSRAEYDASIAGMTCFYTLRPSRLTFSVSPSLHLHTTGQAISAPIWKEVDLDDMEVRYGTTADQPAVLYQYGCRCGDVFRVSEDALLSHQDVHTCASCSLTIRVLYDEEEPEPGT